MSKSMIAVCTVAAWLGMVTAPPAHAAARHVLQRGLAVMPTACMGDHVAHQVFMRAAVML